MHIGRCMMIGIDGLTLDQETANFIRDNHIGGVILFKRNYENPQQLRELTTSLMNLVDYPLIISVDQEGGRVARFSEPFTRVPPMATIGASDNADEAAREIGQVLAKELMACGIHLNFAPVMDIHTNPDNPVIGDRAFSNDPHVVAKLGGVMIDAMQSTGVAACAKHFPGHGDTSIDSHLALPYVDYDQAYLQMREWIPFMHAIAHNVATIMTAHIMYTSLDSARPASISSQIIQTILREEMNYKGVIISDDLIMGGITEIMPVHDAAINALDAGNDMILICHDLDKQKQAYQHLLNAYQSKEICHEHIAVSLQRINTLTSTYVR